MMIHRNLPKLGNPNALVHKAPRTAFYIVLASGLLLGGCASSDDVEINLPFVGNVMAKSKSKEEKVATRGSLVLPPKVDTLPEPVAANQAAGEESWPDDPDLRKKKEEEVAAAKQAKYEREGDWKGERNTGNGLEDFNKKVNWSERQSGIFQKWKDSQEDTAESSGD